MKIFRFSLIIFSFVLIIVLGYEARFVDRTINKVGFNSPGSPKYMSGELSHVSFMNIASHTFEDLLSFKSILKYPTDICRTEMLIRGSISKERKYHFTHALLLSGIFESRLSEDEKIFSSLELWCEELIESDGRLRIKVKYIDECMLGYIFCELYERTQRLKYKVAAEQFANYLLEEYPRSSNGTLPYSKENIETSLIDDKGMICGFLIRYGEQFDVQEATALGVHQLKEYLDTAIDTDTGLPWQAYKSNVSRKMGLLGWLRGIGWVTMGLSQSLEYLPQTHVNYNELKLRFIDLLNVIKEYQIKGECWPWEIRNPDAHIDASGTSMIGYVVENAIEAGTIDSTWSKISENALIGVLKSTQNNGAIDNDLADVKGIGQFPKYFGPSNYAQGPTTSLYSLVLRRKLHLK